MKKENLIRKLEELYGEMDNFLVDSALLTAVKDFKELLNRLNEIVIELINEEDEEI